MPDEPDYPPDPALDALMIVVGELHRAGIFDTANLASLRRRLDLSGHSELAERISMLPIANALDDPAEIRRGLHVVDGGNGED